MDDFDLVIPIGMTALIALLLALWLTIRQYVRDNRDLITIRIAFRRIEFADGFYWCIYDYNDLNSFLLRILYCYNDVTVYTIVTDDLTRKVLRFNKSRHINSQEIVTSIFILMHTTNLVYSYLLVIEAPNYYIWQLFEEILGLEIWDIKAIKLRPSLSILFSGIISIHGKDMSVNALYLSDYTAI